MGAAILKTANAASPNTADLLPAAAARTDGPEVELLTARQVRTHLAWSSSTSLDGGQRRLTPNLPFLYLSQHIH